MTINEKQMRFDYVAESEERAGRRVSSVVLARESWDAGILSNERIDAPCIGATPALAPHLYQTGTGADSVTITTLREYGARVTFKDGRTYDCTPGHKLRNSEIIISEYARNNLTGAVVYRVAFVPCGTRRVVLEESIEYYPGASVRPLTCPYAHARLATTKTGAFKPRKISAQDTANMFARGMCASFTHIAKAHGIEGLHFHVTPHIINQSTEEKTVVHDNAARKRSMSGAARRKAKKMRAAQSRVSVAEVMPALQKAVETAQANK